MSQSYDSQVVVNVTVETREASYRDAIKAMAKYKFWMFGYYAARWVAMNRLLKDTPYHDANPFRRFVQLAVVERGELDDARPHERDEARRMNIKLNDMYPSKSELDEDIYIPDPDDLHAVVNYDEPYEDLTDNNTPRIVVSPPTHGEAT